VELNGPWTSPLPGADADANLILIIDDSTDAIRLLNSMLKGMGQVLFATSGPDGIALALQRRPHLILLDVEMAGMDGYQVCRRLKADPELSSSAVIFVTADSSVKGEIAALDAGAVDFISKPLNAPLVRARVRTHLTLCRATAALQQLADRDALTGLYNRRFFDEALGKEFLRHKRQLLPLSVAFIDIDHFKTYNDLYGHQQGDACLAQVAKVLGESVQRPGEIACRYGGEEFVILLPYTSGAEAEKFGQLLCRRVSALAIAHERTDNAMTVSVSVGLATSTPGEGGTAASLLAAADGALYRAKASGRGCAVLAGSTGAVSAPAAR
jgi:diguanylate cyclase (GGDEF)-like protein